MNNDPFRNLKTPPTDEALAAGKLAAADAHRANPSHYPPASGDGSKPASKVPIDETKLAGGPEHHRENMRSAFEQADRLLPLKAANKLDYAPLGDEAEE